MPSIDYSDVFQLVEKEILKKEKVNFLKNNYVRSRIDTYTDPIKSVREKVTQGEKRLEFVEHLLEHDFGLNRTKHQREFHNLILNSLAPIICDVDWEICAQKVMEERGWKVIRSLTIALLPRRFGKSVAVNLIIAAVAIACALYPLSYTLKQGLFFTAQRTSDNNMRYIKQFIKKTKYTYLLKKETNEMLILSQFGLDSEKASIVSSFPSNAKVSTIFFYGAFLRIHMYTCLYIPLSSRYSFVKSFIGTIASGVKSILFVRFRNIKILSSKSYCLPLLFV